MTLEGQTEADPQAQSPRRSVHSPLGYRALFMIFSSRYGRRSPRRNAFARAVWTKGF